MLKNIIYFRKATSNDLDFMADILVDAALASGVQIDKSNLAGHSDAYQYIAGFPAGSDVGIIAETQHGQCVGAAWVRLLPTDAHAIEKHLPELTMGIVAEYRRLGIGKRLMEALYAAVQDMGIAEISLGVHKHNLPAIMLYKQQAWIEEGAFGEYVMMRRTTG